MIEPPDKPIPVATIVTVPVLLVLLLAKLYADTALSKRIGSLDPRERCYCYGVHNGRALVRYKINGTNNYKIGFAKWLGGVK